MLFQLYFYVGVDAIILFEEWVTDSTLSEYVIIICVLIPFTCSGLCDFAQMRKMHNFLRSQCHPNIV